MVEPPSLSGEWFVDVDPLAMSAARHSDNGSTDLKLTFLLEDSVGLDGDAAVVPNGVSSPAPSDNFLSSLDSDFAFLVGLDMPPQLTASEVVIPLPRDSDASAVYCFGGTSIDTVELFFPSASGNSGGSDHDGGNGNGSGSGSGSGSGLVIDDDMDYLSDSSLAGSFTDEHSTPSPASTSTISSASWLPASDKPPTKRPADDDAKAAKKPRVFPKHPHAPTCQMTAQLNKMLRLNLSEEELVDLDLDTIQEMSGVCLTKTEERQIRQLRRKLKNKIAAASSREKKRNYLDGLEGRVEVVTRENMELRESIEQLRKENAALRARLNEPCVPPQRIPIAAAETPARKGARVSKAHAVSALMVVLMVFGALSNTERLVHGDLGRFSSLLSWSSQSETSMALDEARRMDAAGVLSSSWAPSPDAKTGFIGRRLLVQDDTDDELVNSMLAKDWSSDNFPASRLIVKHEPATDPDTNAANASTPDVIASSSCTQSLLDELNKSAAAPSQTSCVNPSLIRMCDE